MREEYVRECLSERLIEHDFLHANDFLMQHQSALIS